MVRVGRIALAFAFLLGLLVPAASVGAQETLEPLCLGCHGAFEGRLKAPTEHWEESVHKKAGFSCEECHGGADVANQHISDPSSFKPAIFRGKDLPGMCARCHTNPTVMRKYNLRLDQYPLYKLTAHWKVLEAGNISAATCVSCHGIHGIKNKADSTSPVFRGNIPSTCGSCHEDPAIVGDARAVVIPYWSGVHGRILKGEVPGMNPAAAPVCTDCHGVHRLHVFDSAKEEVEACAACHSGIAKQFRQSYHVKFIDERKALRCSNCHDSHKNDHPTAVMLEGDGPGHCGSCHRDPVGRPLRVAAGMKRSIQEVEKLIGRIEGALEKVEHSGRFNDDWVSKFEDVKSASKEIGPVTHSLDLIKVRETAATTLGQANKLREEIGTFQKDLRTRQLGLYMALGVILINIVIVFFKLRSLPSDEQETS